MYRMNCAMGLDPSYGTPAPSSVPQAPPIASLLQPVYPVPIVGAPATTGPSDDGRPPEATVPGMVPPTLAIPPGTVPVYPPTNVPVAPPGPQLPGNFPLPGDVVGPTTPPTAPPPKRPLPPVTPSGVKAWWDEQSMEKKALYAAGGAAVLGVAAWFAFGRKKMRPNRAAPPRRATGEVITLRDGSRFGHTIPPKEYRTQGATRKSDYAWPDGYKYPLVFRRADGSVDVGKSQRHVRSAASYFARYKDRYPPRVRREIASNINRAKKRFDVGGEPATP